MDFEITHYEEKYASQLVSLFEEFQGYLVALDPLRRLRRLNGYGESVMKKTLEEVRANDGAFYIAIDSGKVIGFIVALVERLSDNDLLGVVPSTPGRINELYVVPGFRGRGVATRLMSVAEGYLKQRGCDVIKVEVFYPNEAAKSLYKKLGYEPRDIDNMKKLY